MCIISSFGQMEFLGGLYCFWGVLGGDNMLIRFGRLGGPAPAAWGDACASAIVKHQEADIGQSLYHPSAWTRNVCRVMSGLGIMFVQGILKRERCAWL